MEDWEFERIPESNATELRFSDCLEKLTNNKYYVGVVGRGVKGIELPLEATEYIDFALIRNSKDSQEFLAFIDIIGRECSINTYADYVVNDYKAQFAEKALNFRLPTFIIQEMKKENALLPNRYLWVSASTVLKYPISHDFMSRKNVDNRHVPLPEWNRRISTFITFIADLPDLSDLFAEYKGDPLVFPAYAGFEF